MHAHLKPSLFLLCATLQIACGAGDDKTSSTNTGPDCKPYHNEGILGTLTVTVQNNRAETIYLSTGQCERRYSVKAPGFTAGHADLSSADITCEQAMKSSDYPLDCLDTSVEPIPAGQSASFVWSGLIYDDMEMIDACFGPSSSAITHPKTCQRGQSPAEGTLELDVTLYATATCDGDFCNMPTSPFHVTKSFVWPGEGKEQIDVN